MLPKKPISIFLFFLVIQILFRFAAVYLTDEFTLNASIASGIMSDIFAATYITIFIYLFATIKLPIISASTAAFILFITVINLFSVLELGTFAGAQFYSLVFNKTFILGSGWKYLLGSISITVFFSWIFYKVIKNVRITLKEILILSSLLVASYVFKTTNQDFQINLSSPLWQQENIVNQYVKYIFSTDDDLEIPNVGNYIFHQNLDLKGNARFEFDSSRKKNVLLILLESVPGVSVNSAKDPELRMPLLSEIFKNRALKFTNILAHNRQTHRGEYAVLCGTFPNLSLTDDKMSMFFAISSQLDCLPQILKKEGYKTVYMQSADISYMGKDVFMPKAGFEKVIAKNELPKEKISNMWGVDDKTLFEEALKEIQNLQSSNKPWFMTVLTVGTHHPFAVPESFKSEKESGFGRSLDYLDHAFDSFFHDLEKTGVLKDTIVIITADESKGGLTQSSSENFDKLLIELSQLYVPLGVIGPDIESMEISDRYYHKDIAVSILDYLQIDNVNKYKIGNRSLFRKYDSVEPVAFGNVYAGKVFFQKDESTGIVCNKHLTACNEFPFDINKALPDKLEFTPAKSEDILNIRSFLETNEINQRVVNNLWRPILSEENFVISEAVDFRRVLRTASYFDISKNTEISAKFDILVEQGEVEILARLVSGGARVIHESKGWEKINHGSRFKFSFNEKFETNIKNAEFQIFVTRKSDEIAIIKLNDAKFKMTSFVN